MCIASPACAMCLMVHLTASPACVMCMMVHVYSLSSVCHVFDGSCVYLSSVFLGLVHVVARSTEVYNIACIMIEPKCDLGL